VYNGVLARVSTIPFPFQQQLDVLQVHQLSANILEYRQIREIMKLD
jgi:hypothetical protein